MIGNTFYDSLFMSRLCVGQLPQIEESAIDRVIDAGKER